MNCSHFKRFVCKTKQNVIWFICCNVNTNIVYLNCTHIHVKLLLLYSPMHRHNPAVNQQFHFQNKYNINDNESFLYQNLKILQKNRDGSPITKIRIN
jgi:hypothetical protein